MQPEAMVAEPGAMGWSHRGYGVGARGYGSLVILVSAPVPLGLVWVLNWVGVGPRGLWD